MQIEISSGFNRTFMELKPRNTSCNVVDALQALIGPLWN